MDKEQARFILQSFRPDGADAADADFAEALQIAAEDRELGEWLAGERATDAAFASALCEVEIPEELRQHILAVMHGEKPADPSKDEAMDDLLRGAMSEVQPPVGLRDQIIAAMEMEKLQGAPGNVITPKTSWFSGWPKIAAIAAAVVLGAFFAFKMTPGDDGDQRLTSHDVQHEAGRVLNASFELDVKSSDRGSINTWLVSNELPTASILPTRLQELKSLGCKKIKLPGDRYASLLCFLSDSVGMVHLVIVKNEYVKDLNLPTMDKVRKKDCYHCPETEWNVARWQDKENTFILLAKSDASRKDELLQFF